MSLEYWPTRPRPYRHGLFVTLISLTVMSMSFDAIVGLSIGMTRGNAVSYR